MKNKLSPWQIGVISIAGVAVIGGSIAGIGYGINKKIDNSVSEKVSAALEDMYTQGTETFEEDTAPIETTESTEPAQTEQEEKKPTEKKPEPETVIVYVVPSTEAPITWEYDAKLSEEVSKLMGQKSPEGIFDPTCYTGKCHPENFIHGNTIGTLNDTFWFVGDPGSVSAESIARAWTSFVPIKGNYFIEVYRYSNGWIYAFVSKS